MDNRAYDPRRDENLPDALLRETSLEEMFFNNDLVIDSARSPVICGERFHIYCVSAIQSAGCPCCSEVSRKTHGYSRRNPQAVPVAGFTTVLHIRGRRFICQNPGCPQKTFTARQSSIKPSQQKTDDVTLTVFAVSIFCSDVATAMICQSIGINISHDTVRRILEKICVEDEPDIESVGIDDVCNRKGRTYHTVIYDGNDHHMLAMLDGRDGIELKEWLKAHKKIKVVARDRANAYAAAIKEVLPECLQVADRFHILQNLIGYLRDIFNAEVPKEIYFLNGKLQEETPKMPSVTVPKDVDPEELARLDYDKSMPVDQNGEEIKINTKRANRKGRRENKSAEGRQKRYEKAAAVREEWNLPGKKKKKEVATKFGISIPSLNKYISMTDEEVEKLKEVRRNSSHSIVEEYYGMIYQMLQDSIKPEVIAAYVTQQGYQGTRCALEEKIMNISKNHFNRGTKFWKKLEYIPDGVERVSRADILKYITIKDKEKMNDSPAAKYYDQICEKYPATEKCRKIWEDFHSILMGKDPAKLEPFLKEHENGQISSFINGIKRDIDAVRAAITEPTNSGWVEGGNNKEKCVKRIMYGRARTEHLFLKCYAASAIVRTDRSARDLLLPWLSS